MSATAPTQLAKQASRFALETEMSCVPFSSADGSDRVTKRDVNADGSAQKMEQTTAGGSFGSGVSTIVSQYDPLGRLDWETHNNALIGVTLPAVKLDYIYGSDHRLDKIDVTQIGDDKLIVSNDYDADKLGRTVGIRQAVGIANLWKKMIPESTQVTRIFTEREPCRGCNNYLVELFPTAQVEYLLPFN